MYVALKAYCLQKRLRWCIDCILDDFVNPYLGVRADSNFKVHDTQELQKQMYVS